VPDLFFNAPTPTAGPSYMVRWTIAQFVVEFVPAPPNRFGMKAGNLRDSLESTMPQTHGLAGSHPATLLLIQPAQQDNELSMIFPSRMSTRTTGRTITLANRKLSCHCQTPFLGVDDSLH
jgi:hypothetical protein